MGIYATVADYLAAVARRNAAAAMELADLDPGKSRQRHLDRPEATSTNTAKEMPQ